MGVITWPGVRQAGAYRAGRPVCGPAAPGVSLARVCPRVIFVKPAQLFILAVPPFKYVVCVERFFTYRVN